MSIAQPPTSPFAPSSAGSMTPATRAGTPRRHTRSDSSPSDAPSGTVIHLVTHPRAWPMKLAALLGGGAALLVALGLVGQWLKHVVGVKHSFGFVFQFAPDEEGNLATWYASTLLLTCAALLGAIAWRNAGRRYRRHWAGLAVLLALMSADETAQTHEMLIAPLRAIWPTGGVFHFAWVIPGIAFAACVALACAGFVRHLPPRTRNLLLAAGALYLGGALGVEMVDGYYASRWGAETFSYALLTCLEEALELSGAVLLAYTLADHLQRTWASLEGAGAARYRDTES